MLAAPDFLLIGHITADLTARGRIAGGAVSYAARTAHAFGLRVAVLTSAIPDDPVLDELRPYVHELIVLPAEQTTTYENIYSEQGRIQYVRGVAAPIEPEHVPEHFRRAPLVYLGPIAGDTNPAIAALFPPESWVLLTLQGWLRRWEADGRVRFKRWFDAEALKHIDIVVFSEEDISEAPQMEEDYRGAVDHLYVTRAEKGGTHYEQGQPVNYQARPRTLVNPTGAGDVFAASLLASLLAFNGDFVKATEVAAELAANSITRIGLPSAPTPEEATAALAEVRGA
jgi:sugar/nucleoside kinase (ribokinase family)